MANQDFFMEIAMTRHPLSDLVKEVEPVEGRILSLKEWMCHIAIMRIHKS